MQRSNSLFTCACLILLSAPSPAQVDPVAFMAEGNALVRSGIYETALLRYREAANAGLDTPLLHYNLGVVHYKLQRYGDAAAEFQLATEDDALGALALYNRGLALRAAGDSVGSEAAFRAAAERADDPDLRRLAERAAGSASTSDTIPTRRARASPRSAPADERVGEFRGSVDVRVGQDDNIYRTPSQPYVDLADPAQPTITPTVQASSFMPIEVRAAYILHNETGDTDFLFGYELDGDFYSGGFTNANRVAQRLAVGASILLDEREKHRRTLQSAFFVREYQETNFDPDDGLERDAAGVDISDRFSYRAAGMQGEYAHTIGAWHWGFDLRVEGREYHPVAPVASYDQNYYFAATSIAYDFSDATSFWFGLRGYRRLYDDRQAYDLNGEILPTNPAQHYSYRGAQFGIRQRVAQSIDIDFDYLKLDRTDEFLGYYDYTQDVLRVRAEFRPRPRFTLSAGAISRSYYYPRAFAFNAPAAGPRELDELSGEFWAEFRLTRTLSLWAELLIIDVTSTDARAQYARTQAILGARWRH